jgi:hypothetical protein
VKPVFLLKRRASRTKGPTQCEHKVNPLFQQRWNGIPEKLVLQNDDIVRSQQGLFALDVYYEI